MNPYHQELDDTFRGEYVRVTAGDRTYEGYARIFNFNDGGVILHGAMRDGEHVGSVELPDYDMIEHADAPELMDIPVEALRDSPYSARQYRDADIDEYARDLRMRGAMYSFPTARPVGETEYELIGGHRRTEAARRAGFETIPVRVITLSDWDALQRFVDEHIPLSETELTDASDEERGRYTEDEITRSLEAMQQRWDTDQLREIPALDVWLENDWTLTEPTQRLELPRDSQSSPSIRGTPSSSGPATQSADSEPIDND